MGSNPTLAAMFAGASRLFCFCEQHKATDCYIQNGQIAADAMDGELAAQFSMAYVANYWRAAKTVYNFASEFLRTLAETEDAPIYSDIMMRLPYRDFVVNNPRLKSRACISESTL